MDGCLWSFKIDFSDRSMVLSLNTTYWLFQTLVLIYFKILSSISELQPQLEWLHINIQAASTTLTFEIGAILSQYTLSWYAKHSCQVIWKFTHAVQSYGWHTKTWRKAEICPESNLTMKNNNYMKQKWWQCLSAKGNEFVLMINKHSEVLLFV